MVLGSWKHHVSSSLIRRSSQTLAVVEKNAYIYGGELRPREPVDSGIYICSVGQGECLRGFGTVAHLLPQVLMQCSKQEASSPERHVSAVLAPQMPQPRVGSASTALRGRIYIFSGRGGTAMAPIEERGAFWSFDPATQSWSEITPEDSKSPFPPGRSYHSLANDGNDTIYLHAGCLERDRLSDLWSFSVSQRQWQRRAAAPGPARGGTSITFAGEKLWRMNGFDGIKEQGGTLDMFDPRDGNWNTISFATDGHEGPGPRSVCCLLALKICGRDSLLTMFGECAPSDLGHQGAGRMLGDIWVFDIGSGRWQEVQLPDGGDGPSPRGWFAADTVDDSSVVIQGGLSTSNERLDDVWRLDFS